MSTPVKDAGMTPSATACDKQAVVVLKARRQDGSWFVLNHNFAGIPVEYGAQFIEGELAPT